jgi:hypothetical protein
LRKIDHRRATLGGCEAPRLPVFVGDVTRLGLMPTTPRGALGTHNNEKRRLTLEDVGRRFRRSDAVSCI